MLAKENEYLQEAANSLYIANADENSILTNQLDEQAQQLNTQAQQLDAQAQQLDAQAQQLSHKDARIAELEALLKKKKK